MIIVITPENVVRNEAGIINQMFQEGLDLLHIRKPFIDQREMVKFISRVDQSFYDRLVLHSHYEVGKDFNISRLHFREADRISGLHRPFTENILSTSVHDIENYNDLGKEWEYSFISPVFPSISKKGYGENSTVMDKIQFRNNSDVKLIVLGGIDESNIYEIFARGVDGVALLGAIWENDQPLNVFKTCRKSVLS